jgi:hypothetical protein
MIYRLTQSSIAGLSTQGLVLSCYQDRLEQYRLEEMLGHQVLAQGIQAMIDNKAFVGKEREVNVLPTYGMMSSQQILLVGLGQAARFSLHQLRLAAATAAKAASRAKV